MTTKTRLATLGVGMLGLAGCINPQGMMPVGKADDAGYVYHYAQACTNSWCGSGLGSAALYGPVRTDGTREVIPLGSASITSTGSNAALIGGLVLAGTADGLSHRTW